MGSIGSPQEGPKAFSEIVSVSGLAEDARRPCKKSGGSPVTDKRTGAITVSSSTGPRTLQGKNRSKSNAMKHGIFSNIVVLPSESRPDYGSLLNGLRESFQPVGSLEDILVEKLASLLWRYRRLISAEGAEIRKHREFLRWDEGLEQTAAAEHQARRRVAEGETFWAFDLGFPEGLIWQVENPQVLDRCLQLLQKLGELVARGHRLHKSGEAVNILRTIYGGPNRQHLNETLFDEYEKWRYTANVDDDERKRQGCATPRECRENVLNSIAAEIQRLNQFKKKQSQIEDSRTEIEKLRQGVPDTPALDRLMRYEVSLERAFDRTLSQLERAQRLRMGQMVPPALRLELGS
jgi:hypothetical protein